MFQFLEFNDLKDDEIVQNLHTEKIDMYVWDIIV